MDAVALQMALYELDGLPIVEGRLSDKPIYEYVDKLRDILLERVFKKDVFYSNVFPGSSSSSHADSVRTLFDDRQYWDISWLNLACDCGVETWNRCAGFTYDIIDFALICLVSCFSGEDILDLTSDTFTSYLPEVYEFYYSNLEDEDEDATETYYEELACDCMDFIEAMKSCTTINTCWESERSPGLVLLKDFSTKVFSDILTPIEVFENIQSIAEFCFGSLEGIDRTLYTFMNQSLNVVLRNKNVFVIILILRN